jgi:hypothetical protein
MLNQGSLTKGGRLSTVDLLVLLQFRSASSMGIFAAATDSINQTNKAGSTCP